MCGYSRCGQGVKITCVDDAGGCDAGDLKGFRKGAMNAPEEARPLVGGYGQPMRFESLVWRGFSATLSDEEDLADESGGSERA
jgi:hypothetical protein